MQTGTQLGHFAILAQLGAGGMGEVFRARDARLEREVAIKVLPSEFSTDPDRLRRFEREVKTLARLSHPNILAIHDFGREGDVVFAVTELLEGETLKERLGKQPMALDQALGIGAAIADGLAAAHDRNVVHRDIKPSNVFLTFQGTVKILDFGLARIEKTAKEQSGETADASTFTQTGAVLGTPGYMSPEQVKGRPADARSDIFSFGCMLYEMVTGLSPFKRETSVETMTAILKENPPEVDAGPEANRLLRRCLNKNPVERFQSASDLAYSLRSLLETTPSGGTVKPVTDQRPFVAVLPFANLTADPDQEYFCDGMADELIIALAQVSGLRVVARTSSFAFKERNQDVREIGDRLGVGAVVEGSVRKVGDKLRITAQLIDTSSGLHLWSNRFDRQAENVFEIQDEISLAVVDKLEVELLGRERAAVVKRPSDNVEAHNACLRGWYHWNQMTPEGGKLALEYFNKAIDLDPALAWAYQGLGALYSTQTCWGELPSEAYLAVIVPIVDQMRTLEESYLTHAMPAYVDAFVNWDWEISEKSHRRALDLAPNVADLHATYALVLLLMERIDEATFHLRKTQELDPLSPLWYTWASTWLSWAGHPEEALFGVERAVEMHPHHWMPRFCLCSVQLQLGRIEEARTNGEIAFEMTGGQASIATRLASACYLMGDTSRGDELFTMLRKRAQQTWVPPTLLGWLHLVRGEIDEAFERFDEAVRRKCPLAFYLSIDSPVSIPEVPRFDELFDRLRLPR